MSFRVAICTACWFQKHPERVPVQAQLEERQVETCSWCDMPTLAGIFLRADPGAKIQPVRRDLPASAAYRRYCELVFKLLAEREETPDGELSQEREAEHTAELTEHWNAMSEAEQSIAMRSALGALEQLPYSTPFLPLGSNVELSVTNVGGAVRALQSVEVEVGTPVELVDQVANDKHPPVALDERIYIAHDGMPFADYTCNRCEGRRVGVGEYTAICGVCIADRFSDEEQPDELSIVVPRDGATNYLMPREVRSVDNPGAPTSTEGGES